MQLVLCKKSSMRCVIVTDRSHIGKTDCNRRHLIIRQWTSTVGRRQKRRGRDSYTKPKCGYLKSSTLFKTVDPRGSFLPQKNNILTCKTLKCKCPVWLRSEGINSRASNFTALTCLGSSSRTFKQSFNLVEVDSLGLLNSIESWCYF